MAKTPAKAAADARWKKKAYRVYAVNLRYDTDYMLMDYIESRKDIGTTELFRRALTAYMTKE